MLQLAEGIFQCEQTGLSYVSIGRLMRILNGLAIDASTMDLIARRMMDVIALAERAYDANRH